MPIAGSHAWPVTRPAGQGGTASGDQACQYRSGLPVPDRDDTRDQPAMLGDIDGLTVPDSRQNLACVVAQIPQPHRVHIRSNHVLNVLQICGHI